MAFLAQRRGARSRLWTPRDLGSALSLWLDANDMSTVILNGSSVSGWRDKSVNNNVVANGTAGAQPIFNRSATGNSLSFNGTNQVLFGSPGTTGFAFNATPRSSFAVINPGALINGGSIFQYGNGAATGQSGFGYMVLVDKAANRWLSTNNFDTKTATAVTAAQQLYSLNFVGGNVALSTNGTVVKTAAQTITTANFDVLHVGGAFWSNTNANWFLGSISAIIATTGILSSAQFAMVEGWLAWQYNLQTTLPAMHPYKLQPPRVAA
jgi:hypothetical protein